ncbi:MAG: hypothetical protein KJZ86_24170 [Caldilineaceae bacterium]|nr:hypothetical protein [Caldilineaceae bacterium]
MTKELSTAQRLLLQKKIHVAGNAYTDGGRRAQARFSNGWGGAIALAHLLGDLPEIALHWWAAQPNGHLLVTAGDDSYALLLAVDEREVGAVACIPIGWLVDGKEQALAGALRPLDHLLGCAGAADGLWLSDGGGITPRWQRVGEQIARLFPLGYGEDEASRQDPHSYLAAGLAAALTNRRRLNVADPKLERLLLASLLSPYFWQRNVPPAKMTADFHNLRNY